MGFLNGFTSARQAELEAFNRLVMETQDAVYTLAYAILGNEGSAERAVQSAFIRAYQGRVRYKVETHKLLVYRGLVDACQQELNRGKNDFPTVEQLSVDAHEDAWSCMLSLPLSLRLAAALVDVAGLDYEQAAEVLSVSVKEIRRRLALARSMLVRPSS